jgi:pimeloyl-ACP methyl ester carboxylesterase
MGDFIFSDFVVQKGYAYASTNKGMLNFFFTSPADPVACRLSPPPAATSTLFTHFYVDRAENTIREWFRRTLEATDVAEISLEAHYGRPPDRVYLFGISNGGHVVRRLLVEFPSRFDGGVDWEGVYWSAAGPNILIDLPFALRKWDEYLASGLSRTGPAHQEMLAFGYPPDLVAEQPTVNAFSPVLGSFWETHANNYWDVTTCVFVRDLDPLFAFNQLDPLAGRDTGDYDYLARRKPYHLSPRVGQISTEGHIARPLITVHGTMDALLPLKRHARTFRDAVVGAGRSELHRLYEIQNGNHIEKYRQACCGGFKELRYLQPHAHRAFDLVAAWVEGGVAPPPSQCVPRDGVIDDPGADGRLERCAELLEE